MAGRVICRPFLMAVLGFVFPQVFFYKKLFEI